MKVDNKLYYSHILLILSDIGHHMHSVIFIVYTLFLSVIFQFFVRIIFNLNRNQFCIFDSRVCVSTKSLISWRRLYRIVVPKIVVASVFRGGIGIVFVFKVIEFWPLTRRRGRSNLFSILAMAVTPPVRTYRNGTNKMQKIIIYISVFNLEIRYNLPVHMYITKCGDNRTIK